MSRYTFSLVNEMVTSDPDAQQAYQQDARYLAELTAFREALLRAHDALIAAGNREADDVVKILAKGFPDPQEALRRVRAQANLAEVLSTKPATKP